jgi:uncharacterized membrane protein
VSTKAQAGNRLIHVDVLRGLAVVFMLTLHTAHGWLSPAVRVGTAETLIRSVGGMAAPLFLWLSGVSLGLRWRVRAERGLDADVRGELARGLQLVVLGYLLRVQMWMVDGGGVLQAAAWQAAVPLVAGELALYVLLGRLARGRGLAPGLLAAATVGVVIGMERLFSTFPARLDGLLRVDVLQAIGASMALVGATAHRLRQRPVLLYLCGAATACLTPLMRDWVPGPLPEPLAAYIAQWAPGEGRQPLTMFPLFPWLSYVFLGAAVADLWGERAAQGRLATTLAWGTLCGAALAFASWEGHRWMHALLAAVPDANQPLRVVHRLSVGLLLAGPALWLYRVPGLSGMLQKLGGASLLVYWVHLEFAFGRAGTPLKRSLDLPTWGLALALLTLAMTGLAALRLGRGRHPRLTLKNPILGPNSSSSRPPVNSET